MASRRANALPVSTSRPTPFLKWAGGKSQLLTTFDQFFPDKFEGYFEPFLGGGAVFFHLYGTRPAFHASLSDGNQELINAYQIVRDQVGALCRSLSKHKNESDYFYSVRAQDVTKLSKVERASRLIYLNKTCFNGLYRVNSKGHFNVPFGSYKNPRLCDENNLHAVSAALSDADLSCANFESVLDKAGRGDFVYFDPPYQPLSTTSNFTGYTKSSFTEADQQRLADVAEQLKARGCFVMLSNSDNEFIRKIYRRFRVHTVMATRAINCRADRRGKISELVITSY